MPSKASRPGMQLRLDVDSETPSAQIEFLSAVFKVAGHKYDALPGLQAKLCDLIAEFELGSGLTPQEAEQVISYLTVEHEDGSCA